jgi:hypothetical protein
VICSKCGIKIMPDNYNAMVGDMSRVLNKLLRNPHELVERAQTTLICADEYSWDKRLSKLNNMYIFAIQAHSRRFNSSLIQTSITACYA